MLQIYMLMGGWMEVRAQLVVIVDRAFANRQQTTKAGHLNSG